jgi:hypothetical protein
MTCVCIDWPQTGQYVLEVLLDYLTQVWYNEVTVNVRKTRGGLCQRPQFQLAARVGTSDLIQHKHVGLPRLDVFDMDNASQ